MSTAKHLFLTALAGGLIAAIAVTILSRTPRTDIAQPSNESGVPPTVIALDVSDVVERANPAVVSIIISQEVPVVEQYFDDPFGDIFGGDSPLQFRVPRYRQNGTEEREVGGGSGFLVSADGFIVTNAHVVAQENAVYTVLLNDDRTFDARVIARDRVLDIALLKIDATDLPFLSFGDSDALKLGQAVIAIGNALSEFRNSVSTGVVSGLSRSIVAGSDGGQNELLENVIQTDAAINPGNSGGPLLNLAGEVVGINVAVARGSENIGFALPANIVKSSVESIRTHGRVVRPFMGVRYRLVTPALAEANALAVDHGAIVLRGDNPDELAVLPGSPADKAGIEENDIILEIDGAEIDERHSPASLIRRKSVGDSVSVRLLHDGTERTLDIVLEEAP